MREPHIAIGAGNDVEGIARRRWQRVFSHSARRSHARHAIRAGLGVPVVSIGRFGDVKRRIAGARCLLANGGGSVGKSVKADAVDPAITRGKYQFAEARVFRDWIEAQADDATGIGAEHGTEAGVCGDRKITAAGNGIHRIYCRRSCR